VNIADNHEACPEPDNGTTCQCIDWFHEGEAKAVEVDGVQIVVRFIGRKGRRGRIAIEAPAGARFRPHER
jgi:hypothetical protein